MRNVLITGGTRGIGAACSMAFSENGDRVFAVYEKDEKSAKEMEKHGIITIKADVSEESDVQKTAEILHGYGKIDVLVNNAGISRVGVINDVTSEEWDRIFAVNVKGAFLMTKAFLPDMIEKKCGRIVNISSVWGQTGGSCEVAYSATKAALIGYTKALAKELAPSGICVNCVAPGVVDTKMNECFKEETMEMLKEEIPLERIGTAKEIADAVFFLASEKAGYITGQTLAVNGGMYI